MFGQSAGRITGGRSSGLYARCSDPSILTDSERASLQAERDELEKSYARADFFQRVRADSRIADIDARLTADRMARGLDARKAERREERRQQGVSNSARATGPQYLPPAPPHAEARPARTKTDQVATNCASAPASNRKVLRRFVGNERHPTKGLVARYVEYVPIVGGSSLSRRADAANVGRAEGPMYLAPASPY